MFYAGSEGLHRFSVMSSEQIKVQAGDVLGYIHGSDTAKLRFNPSSGGILYGGTTVLSDTATAAMRVEIDTGELIHSVVAYNSLFF